MVMHPPMLYMGYVGFSVAFAFAIAALLGGRLDATWARWSRPWTTLAWSFLTIGIMIGSWWAYYTLGWGGWWFWDPVENASFMPGSSGPRCCTRLQSRKARHVPELDRAPCDLRVLAVADRNVPRSLRRADLGARVRNRSARGVFILAFLVVVIGGSLVLYALRAPRVGVGGRFALVSRETALLANNVLLLGAAAPFCWARSIRFSRCIESRQALGGSAVFRLGFRAVDDAARISDGNRSARALEAGVDSGSCTAAALGVRRKPRHGSSRAARHGDGSRGLRSAFRWRSGSSPRRLSASATG
jgi:hypothetical protein